MHVVKCTMSYTSVLITFLNSEAFDQHGFCDASHISVVLASLNGVVVGTFSVFVELFSEPISWLLAAVLCLQIFGSFALKSVINPSTFVVSS